MKTNFETMCEDVIKESEEIRTLIQNYLASDMDIDEMDYKEFLNYSFEDCKEDKELICHWKDYKFLLGKQQALKSCGEDELRFLEDMNKRWMSMQVDMALKIQNRISSIKKGLGVL